MCSHDQETITFNADQATTSMRSAATGAGIAMVILGPVGMAIALTAGGQLADVRAAYLAGVCCILLAGHMVVAVGTRLGALTLLRHQLAMERLAEQEHAALRGEIDGLKELMAHLHDSQERQIELIGDYLEDQLRPRRYEHHNGHRHN
ncbi:hypothetical protein [Actinomadura litoris]|uniref:Uncharacterized protein n=1 Tax=Actinomadura litoris TaxID=2678616 RepID=A0A7K1LB08_9ACTN|nr:hypothetical protein [Actinomadura litoris]MUN41503.1 hypothetical protein [Actinomadura litoris]